MDDEHKMKDLIKKKNQLMAEINDEAVAELVGKTVKDIFPLFVPQGHINFIGNKVTDVVDKEAEIRQQMHLLWLSGAADPENYFGQLIQRHKPSSAERSKMVRASLEQVCDVIRTRHSLFACELAGVGSYHDGTKMFCHDEMDFIFLLKHRPDVDYRITPRSDSLLGYAICPIKESDLHGWCLDKDLLEEDELNVPKYRGEFVNVLNSVIPEICTSSGLHFGGWNRPYFGGFARNGPAVTFVVDGVSVDISMAWRVPAVVMETFKVKADHRVDMADFWRVVETALPDYMNLGVLVMDDDDNTIEPCMLSTSLIETKLFQSNSVLHQALQVCKVYKDKLFNLPWPDLRPVFRYLDGVMFDWVLDRLRTKDNQAEQIVRELIVREMGMGVLLLATKRRPLTVESKILDQLEKLHHMCGLSFTRNQNEENDYPSLNVLLDEVDKPAAKAMSFIFKCLILQEWLQAQSTTASTTTALHPSDVALSRIVKNVLQRYLQKLLEDCDDHIYHPLLNYKVYLFSRHYLCRWWAIDHKITDIYCRNVEQIVSVLVDSYAERKQVEC